MRWASRLLSSAFAPEGRLDRVALALSLLTAGVVAWNAAVFDWRMAYDADHHAAYVVTLATGRLPDKADSREFFSPPLPYLLPAVLLAAGLSLDTAIKAGQLQNVPISLGLSLATLLLCERLRPGHRALRWAALSFLGMLPVVQRSFGFFRAEPLLALLCALAVLLAGRQFAQGPPPARRREAAALGLVLGLVLLTRQQGLFVIGAIGILALARARAEPLARRRRLHDLGVAAVVTTVVAGGFYLSLFHRYGTPAAFNKGRAPFSFSNRPAFFYLGSGDGLLFTDPVRPSFKGQFLPLMYADAWGDYYGYFLLYAWDARRDCLVHPAEWEEFLEEKRGKGWLVTNRYSRASELGRINLVSLLPSLVLGAGLVLGSRRLPAFLQSAPAPAEALRGLLALATLLSILGYLALLLTIRHALGSTIKATYLLPVFPFVALLGADALAALAQRLPRIFPAVALALVAVAVHNVPALFNAIWNAPGAGNGPCPFSSFTPGP